MDTNDSVRFLIALFSPVEKKRAGSFLRWRSRGSTRTRAMDRNSGKRIVSLNEDYTPSVRTR